MGRATLIGFSAVAMWALLALLTDASGQVPPFLLSAITFAIGTCVGLVRAAVRCRPPDKVEKIPLQVWVIGIAGLFGYHFFYFTALRNAPAVEASLIAYLWPLLIVLGSALMPGERLRWNHVVGALLGLAGTVLIVTKGGGLAFDARYAFGYAMAGCLRASVVGLFAAVAALPGGADQHRHLVLRGDLGAFARLPSLAGKDGAARWRRPVAGRARSRADAGGCRLLRLGHRRQARQHPGAGRGKLCRAAAVDAGADRGRLRRAVAAHPRRLRADHRRRGAGGEVAVPAQAGDWRGQAHDDAVRRAASTPTPMRH